MEVVFVKSLMGALPGDPQTSDWYEKLKLGEGFHGNYSKMRNIGFHRKFFALLNLAFEYFKPAEISTKWGKPEKNFKTFRKNVTVLAGYHDLSFKIDGTFTMEAQSIAFGNMDQIDFEKLYSATLDVILKRIPLLGKLGKDEVNKLVNKVLHFA